VKRLLAILLTAALTLGITACGGNTQNQSATSQQQEGQQQEGQQQQEERPPAQNSNEALFNEFVVEYARVNPSRTQGVSDGVAFWSSGGQLFLHDIKADKTSLIDFGSNRSSIVYWNEHFTVRLQNTR
jgi:hypothetical protein